MKAHPFHLVKLMIAVWLSFPAFVLAAAPTTTPPATSPYITDVTNSYVYDKVTEQISSLNGFLCMMNAMAPSLMVNSGDYIALVDANSCFGFNSASNEGTSYLPIQVNSSRSSNSTPMYVKMWIDFQDNFVPLYTSASQAPTKAAPYGVFRVDGCLKQAGDITCEDKVGFIDASRSGLSFYLFFGDTSTGDSNELSLQLSAASSTNSGSGILVMNEVNSNVLTPEATLFAYNLDYFYRDDGTAPQCFNRSLKYAQESTWRYGLYDAVTGAQLEHKSGFPIEYSCTSGNTTCTSGKTYNGYVSYYGLSIYGDNTTNEQINVPTDDTVYKINYNNNPPTKDAYRVINSVGKLTKYTTRTTPLSTLHKIPFWYWARTDIAVDSGSLSSGDITTLGMKASNWYEIYWDNGLTQFVVSSAYSGSRMEPLLIPSPINMVAFKSANTYGLYGSSQLFGGGFYIKQTDWGSIDIPTSAPGINVTTQNQDVVYPQDYATVGTLTCISDCPDSTGTLLNPPYSSGLPVAYAAGQLKSYTLNNTTGNMEDSLFSPVENTISEIRSGKLLDSTGMTEVNSACLSCTSYYQYYADAASTYYQWETGPNTYNHMTFLIDPATNQKLTFYPPLPVSFTVPNTAAYGNLSGSTIMLQYGDFGSLWGIPDKCVDITTNAACTYDNPTTATVEVGTSSTNRHWAPQFSIPFNTTEGFVTVPSGVSQGSITAGNQFFVKPLDKEIRLHEAPMPICAALGLTKPVTVTKLPSYADWNNPTDKVGTKPVLSPPPAPRVIHGVKKY